MAKLPRLEDARKRVGLTQAEFAHKAGLNRLTVTRIEAGRGAHQRTTQKLAEALGVEPKELTVSEAPA